MRTMTRYARRALGAAAIVMGTTDCSAHAPKVTESAPAESGAANPRTRTTSDATLNQSGSASTQQYQRIEELIEARAPGVQVIHANGTFALRIRGLSSPSGGSDPLIVIDGSISSAPGTRALDGLNPQDVQRIEVLKDAASTAYYGMRGASGVIVITTRKK